MSLQKYLFNGTQGGNLLFCGAGFSASSLNFEYQTLGVAPPLMKAMNDKLNYEFNDMQIAADEYVEKFGENGLLSLLEAKFSVSKRTSAADAILKYPWSRIYTTNYDDLISQSLTSLGTKHYVANNTETPYEINTDGKHNMWVVHLHGALKKWDTKNFIRSCVLGRESYLRASSGSNWAQELRQDYIRAKAVFFIGFSNSDFYLAENLFSAEASRDKVFFINCERSSEDRELLAKQKRYGEPLALGMDKFSELIQTEIVRDVQPPMVFHSFELCELPATSEDRASAEQQHSFMVSGQESQESHFKDILDESKSYRVPRHATEDVQKIFKQDNAVGIILGGMCSGKSVIFDECIMKMLVAGDTVFRLRSKFTDLVDEVGKILLEHPGCTFAIDDCYSLRDDFYKLLHNINGSGGKLLLTSRTLAYDVAPAISQHLQENTPFNFFNVDILDDEEGRDLIECTDRIAGWGASVTSYSQKKRILEREKNSRLAGFMLGIFKSDHIRRRFKSELDLFRTNGPSAEKALIIALYTPTTELT